VNRPGAALVLALCVGCLRPAIAAPEPSWGLRQLMSSLQQVRSASGEFTERKDLHMLSAPLVSSGTLSYRAPDWMQKVTVSPTPQQFTLDGDDVTMTGGPDGQTHTFSISDAPQIGVLVEAIRATLAGDLPTLDRYYAVKLTGNAADWQLLLQPKDPALTRLVKWIRIAGTQDRIRVIETEESQGDRSTMSIVEDVHDAH
jgi:outer membrane lipoprotein-sorting protein